MGFNDNKPKIGMPNRNYDEHPDKLRNLKRTLKTDASRAGALSGMVISMLTLTISLVTLFSKSDNKPSYDNRNNNYKNRKKMNKIEGLSMIVGAICTMIGALFTAKRGMEVYKRPEKN